jgi:hypothetical protein
MPVLACSALVEQGGGCCAAGGEVAGAGLLGAGLLAGVLPGAVPGPLGDATLGLGGAGGAGDEQAVTSATAGRSPAIANARTADRRDVAIGGSLPAAG